MRYLLLTLVSSLLFITTVSFSSSYLYADNHMNGEEMMESEMMDNGMMEEEMMDNGMMEEEMMMDEEKDIEEVNGYMMSDDEKERKMKRDKKMKKEHKHKKCGCSRS